MIHPYRSPRWRRTAFRSLSTSSADAAPGANHSIFFRNRNGGPPRQNGPMRCLINLLHLQQKIFGVGPWWVPYGTLLSTAVGQPAAPVGLPGKPPPGRPRTPDLPRRAQRRLLGVPRPPGKAWTGSLVRLAGKPPPGRPRTPDVPRRAQRRLLGGPRPPGKAWTGSLEPGGGIW